MSNKDFNIRDAHKSLVSRLLNGRGEASGSLRRAAFDNSGLDEPLREFINKVASAPAKISNSDFAAASEAGFNEDQLFELVICAAVGQASREYEVALLALDKATTNGDTAHAT